MSVALVGAGPGDPGLLTLRGRELLERADVVVYDALVNPEILKHARAGADLIYVGKVASRHALPQDEINRLLALKARAGKRVVRLKGGDPYIFGRGGEEGEYLFTEGIPFEEVPGITSAIAAPAYAGIPLTHRDLVSSVSIVTGHERPSKDESAINWRALATGGSTLVFVMGVKNLPSIAEKLIAEGMRADMPAALVYRGTTAMQRSLFSTLARLPEEAQKACFTNPSVLVVGEVAKLNRQLDWFSRKPLLGRRIVVTRAREQASSMVAALRALGAEVLECPSISIAPLENYAALDEAFSHLRDYRWLIFTSVNGVRIFWRRLEKAGMDSRALGGACVACIGPATASAIRERGIVPDLVPDTYVAESVADALVEREGSKLEGMRILLPRAASARMALPDALAGQGALVDIVPLYETVPDQSGAAQLRSFLERGELDCIAFGSSSTVRYFLDCVPPELLLSHPETVLASIGPITTHTLKEYGLTAAIQPDEYTIPALVEAIRLYFSSRPKENPCR